MAPVTRSAASAKAAVLPKAAVPPLHRATSAGLFDSLEQEAYLQLWRTYDRLRELDERVFAAHGLSAQQYNALRVLRAVAPRPLATSALGARLVSRAPDMTRMLDKLEEQGLVRRRRSAENRRLVEVWITPAGRTAVDRLAAAVRQCGHEQLGHLDRKSLRAFIELLKQARAPHDHDAADAWPGNDRTSRCALTPPAPSPQPSPRGRGGRTRAPSPQPSPRGRGGRTRAPSPQPSPRGRGRS